MYIEVYFVPSAEPVSQATLETESQLVDTVGAGVISGSAGVLNPNNGADQEFATPLLTNSSRSQAIPDFYAFIFHLVCYLLAKYFLKDFVLAMFIEIHVVDLIC